MEDMQGHYPGFRSYHYSMNLRFKLKFEIKYPQVL